jgi:polysaccharide deacetylase family protein (PEP-CTERM system associated)
MENRARYILSVDVEDYFHVEAFSKEISRTEWDRWPTRVVNNTRRVLDLCDEYNVRSTCFVLGWVARKFPSLVREIHERGHELACHSFWHRPVYSLTPEVFREDLRESRQAIEQAGGVRVEGYRAPSWSITAKSLWALDILAEEGFVYDSSIYPIHHDLYGYPGAERFPYRVGPEGRELTEFPPATVQVLGATLPSGGGGYLRIFPFPYTTWALRRLEREDGRAVVVYFHPWELDPDQPRIAARWKSRFRHYTNLGKMESRLRRLLAANRFEPFRELIARNGSASPEARASQSG